MSSIESMSVPSRSNKNALNPRRGIGTIYQGQEGRGGRRDGSGLRMADSALRFCRASSSRTPRNVVPQDTTMLKKIARAFIVSPLMIAHPGLKAGVRRPPLAAWKAHVFTGVRR